MCEPPMITRHTSKMFVMEGQEVSLRCKSIGDPEPSTHWVSPDGKLIGNTSRTICYENGSLDILKASVKVKDMNARSSNIYISVRHLLTLTPLVASHCSYNP